MEQGFGLAVFSPLYQGFLTGKYNSGVPQDSRIGKGETWLDNELNDGMLATLRGLQEIADSRGQTMSQMALAWILHNPAVTTVLVGASRPEQIIENVRCLDKLDFSEEEIARIEAVLA